LLPHSKRVFGHRNRSSFGPNSTRPRLKYKFGPYACVPDPNRSEPSREGRASVCSRAVERCFRARYVPILAILTSWGGKKCELKFKATPCPFGAILTLGHGVAFLISHFLCRCENAGSRSVNATVRRILLTSLRQRIVQAAEADAALKVRVATSVRTAGAWRQCRCLAPVRTA
jgi:hypothetical protein